RIGKAVIRNRIKRWMREVFRLHQSRLKDRMEIILIARSSAKGEKMDMTATDLEVGIRCSVKVEVSEPGAITLPARTLSEVVRELPSEEINIKVDEKSRVQINSGQAIFNLMGLPKEDYPALPKFKTDGEFSIDRESLSEMIKKNLDLTYFLEKYLKKNMM
ncbi:unnamed protein product, partial [marine sediment metagenome]